MKTYRQNPDSEENQEMTKQNEREIFALKMQAQHEDTEESDEKWFEENVKAIADVKAPSDLYTNPRKVPPHSTGGGVRLDPFPLQVGRKVFLKAQPETEVYSRPEYVSQLERRALDDYSAWLNIAHDLGANDGDNCLDFIRMRAHQAIESIRLILPLAKGYAAAHPLKINDDVVAHAEGFLESLRLGEERKASLLSEAVSIDHYTGHGDDDVEEDGDWKSRPDGGPK